ncbi:MAG TPA: hypothetical protein VJP77_09885 [Planctomycetota bacterium]|nr:hypothetical protein [Planctomycetota bacterium]
MSALELARELHSAGVFSIVDPASALTLASLGAQFLGGGTAGASGTAPPASGGNGAVGILSQLSSAFGGLGSAIPKIAALFTGPGRGEIRRKSARDAVAGSPPLVRVQAFLRGRNATPEQISAALREYLPRDPEARNALGAILARVAQLGGSGRAQGEEANTLGDVLKWVLLHETVTRRARPSDSELAGIVLGLAPPAMAPVPAAPIQAQPVGSPLPLPIPSTSLAAGPALAAPMPLLSSVSGVGDTATTEATMPTLLDSFLPAIGSLFAPTAAAAASPFVLPGGAVAGGMGALAGLASSFLPSVGLPFVDLAPSGGAAVFDAFRRTPSGARAQVHIQVNPVTDKPEWFAPVGRPIVFSRDFAVVKRMGKMGRRMVSATGGNRGRMVRRRRGGR